MNARIIIEKDGERWVGKVVDSDDIKIQKDRFGCFCNLNLSLALDELPPVVRTDNSETIANLRRIVVNRDERIRVLQRENAKMREALKPVMEVKMSAERINSYRIHELHVETFSAVKKAQEILAHGCASTQDIMRGEKHV